MKLKQSSAVIGVRTNSVVDQFWYLKILAVVHRIVLAGFDARCFWVNPPAIDFGVCVRMGTCECNVHVCACERAQNFFVQKADFFFFFSNMCKATKSR